MADPDVHAPASARVAVVGGLLVGGALVAVGLFAGVRLLAGDVAAAGSGVAVLLVTLGLVIRAWPTAVVLTDDQIVVRNPIRRRVIAADEVAELRADRRAGHLGPPGSQVAIVASDGRVVRSVASVALPGSAHERAELFLALRRWSAAHDVADGLPHREYGDRGTRHELLVSAEEVEVSAWMRRTDSRGWGDWEAGTLLLPSPGADAGGRARWTDRDPPSHPGTDTAAPRSRPVQLKDAEKVVVRAARFREEEFFGPDTSFLVITTLRRVLEIGLRPDEADLVLRRLRDIDGIESPAPVAEDAG